MTDIRERAQREEVFYPSWRPEPGDMLVGTLVEMKVAPAGQYGEQPIAIVEVEDATEAYDSQAKRSVTVDPGGRVSFWLLHKVAKTAWKRVQPSPGERLAVHRGEQREGVQGEYATYRVVVDRPQGRTVDMSRWIPDDPSPETDVPF